MSNGWGRPCLRGQLPAARAGPARATNPGLPGTRYRSAVGASGKRGREKRGRHSERGREDVDARRRTWTRGSGRGRVKVGARKRTRTLESRRGTLDANVECKARAAIADRHTPDRHTPDGHTPAGRTADRQTPERKPRTCSDAERRRRSDEARTRPPEAAPSALLRLENHFACRSDCWCGKLPHCNYSKFQTIMNVRAEPAT